MPYYMGTLIIEFLFNIMFCRPDSIVQVVNTVFPKMGRVVLERNEERALQLYQYSKMHNEKYYTFVRKRLHRKKKSNDKYLSLG